MKQVDVLIIGSGWSGLAAARHMKENSSSTRVQILEGREYVGGRSRSLLTQTNGRLKAELGSQWIHGGCMKNPMYKLAKEYGCELRKSLYDAGITFSEIHGNQKAFTALSLAEIEKFEAKYLRGKEGFRAYIAKRQDEAKDKSLRVVLEDYKRKQKATPQLEKMLEWMADQTIPQEYGASLEDLSLWWFDADSDFHGDDVLFTEGGYSGLVDKFAAPVRDQIQLESKVTSIDWSSSPAKVQYATSNNDSITIAASYVILTVPLGVLKAKTIDFIPALPKSKQRAIQKIGFGLLNKVIFIWDEKDKLPWSDRDDVNWIERIPKSSPQGLWTEFYNTTTPEGNPVMYAFSVGRMAQQIEQLSDEEIKSQSLAALQSVCAEGTTIADPAEIIITRWGQDEFSYGGYSYNQLGCEPKDRRNLGTCLENRLFFAGEATHRKYFGTTQGALLSGVDAAKQVLAQIKPRTL